MECLDTQVFQVFHKDGLMAKKMKRTHTQQL